MLKELLCKKGPALFELPRQGAMLVPGLVVATSKLLEEPGIEEPLKQVANVATLPGIVSYSIAMPDMHWGYGFPIGGVAATDYEKGVVSPGGVGYDINCGVRLALVPMQEADLKRHGHALLRRIYDLVPSGVGRGHRDEAALTLQDYQKLLTQGASWAIEQGYGLEKDLDRMESRGCLSGADPHAVSADAQVRGRSQLGTIGSGNHFVEIGVVEQIFLEKVAAAWGVKAGQIYLLIHSGSRGLGHQVCQDTLDAFLRCGYADGLVDRQLVAAPIQSADGQQYLKAMSAAANFAFNNRQRILHSVRTAFDEVCSIPTHQIELLYDVCHNIAKIETHEVEGHLCKLCVHRKGATRALGPGAEELSEEFQKTGQPVLVPGDMQRASHLMVGKGHPATFCSCCHGAGRALSRVRSLKEWKGRDVFQYMKQHGVEVMASSGRTVAEEMPSAYKDVDDVVEAVAEAGLADKVARLKPLYAIKG